MLIYLKKIILCLLILCVPFLLAGCEQPRPSGDGWKMVGQLTDGFKTRFVEIAPSKAKDRATYDSVVKELCKDSESCPSIAFILQGDSIPVTQGSKTFMADGGWKNYPTLTFWWGKVGKGDTAEDDYTRWDCDRAGVNGAPLSALCGEGVSEAYSAILTIAGRTGMAEACNWQASKGVSEVIKRYLDSINDIKKRSQLQEDYTKHYVSSRKGPDNTDDCKRLRPVIEKKFEQAKRLLAAKRGIEALNLGY